LPVCVEGPTSHCRSLKRQLAQRAPFTNFRSELSAQSLRLLRRKTTALFLFRTPGKPRPVRKKTWAAAPAPASPARRNALRAKKPLRRHSAGGLVCPDSGVTWPYLPHPIANTPVGHWWAMAATAGRPGAPQIQNLRPLGPPSETSALRPSALRTTYGLLALLSFWPLAFGLWPLVQKHQLVNGARSSWYGWRWN
jgi:hypothetical protein